jgi:hypothetical protein
VANNYFLSLQNSDLRSSFCGFLKKAVRIIYWSEQRETAFKKTVYCFSTI